MVLWAVHELHELHAGFAGKLTSEQQLQKLQLERIEDALLERFEATDPKINMPYTVGQCADMRTAYAELRSGIAPSTTAKTGPFYQYHQQGVAQPARPGIAQPGFVEYDGLVIYPFAIRVPDGLRQSHFVTQSTQMSLGRLDRLRKQLRSWDGIISIAVLADEDDVLRAQDTADVANVMGEACSPQCSDTRRVAEQVKDYTLLRIKQGLCGGAHGCRLLQLLDLHIVVPIMANLAQSYCKRTTFIEGGCIYYPINALRNIAWNYVLTPYVFLNDVDFLPSEATAR